MDKTIVNVFFWPAALLTPIFLLGWWPWLINHWKCFETKGVRHWLALFSLCLFLGWVQITQFILLTVREVPIALLSQFHVPGSFLLFPLNLAALLSLIAARTKKVFAIVISFIVFANLGIAAMTILLRTGLAGELRLSSQWEPLWSESATYEVLWGAGIFVQDAMFMIAVYKRLCRKPASLFYRVSVPLLGALILDAVLFSGVVSYYNESDYFASLFGQVFSKLVVGTFYSIAIYVYFSFYKTDQTLSLSSKSGSKSPLKRNDIDYFNDKLLRLYPIYVFKLLVTDGLQRCRSNAHQEDSSFVIIRNIIRGIGVILNGALVALRVAVIWAGVSIAQNLGFHDFQLTNLPNSVNSEHSKAKKPKHEIEPEPLQIKDEKMPQDGPNARAQQAALAQFEAERERLTIEHPELCGKWIVYVGKDRLKEVADDSYERLRSKCLNDLKLPRGQFTLCLLERIVDVPVVDKSVEAKPQNSTEMQLESQGPNAEVQQAALAQFEAERERLTIEHPELCGKWVVYVGKDRRKELADDSYERLRSKCLNDLKLPRGQFTLCLVEPSNNTIEGLTV